MENGEALLWGYFFYSATFVAKLRLEDEIKQSKKFRSEYEKAVVNITYTYNWLYALEEGLFKPHDLTCQQYNILRILRGQYPQAATIKLLRERMLDKMSDASRLVEKLRQKGFLNRKTCKDDRRNVDVIISDKGLETLSKIDEELVRFDVNFHSLTEEEAARLNELLDKMRG